LYRHFFKEKTTCWNLNQDFRTPADITITIDFQPPSGRIMTETAAQNQKSNRA